MISLFIYFIYLSIHFNFTHSHHAVGFCQVYSYFETDHSRCSVNNNKQLLLIRYKNNGYCFIIKFYKIYSN